MRITTNLGLKKPEGTDVVNIDDFNYNADILDAKVKEISNKLSSISTNAKSTSFDNSENGMSATNVQDAIEENKQNIEANKTSIQSANRNISSLGSSVSALQSELGTNKTTLQNNINAIREVL